MPIVRVPPNCGGMTLASAGAVVAASNLITVPSALEATSLISPYSYPGNKPVQIADIITGATKLFLPAIITNITINSIGYAVVNGISAPVPAQDVSNFVVGGRQRIPVFELVTG